MIGPIASALAFASALAVARRAPQHGPIAAALGASLSYSICAVLNASLPPERQTARTLLIVLGCVAILSGWAYLKAWSWDAGPALGLTGAVAFIVVMGIANPGRYWMAATWLPILASVVVGAVALLRWLFTETSNDRLVRGYLTDGWTITRRIALVLLAADIAGLLFAAWPGVVEWQGRAAAMAVTVLQVGWLLSTWLPWKERAQILRVYAELRTAAVPAWKALRASYVAVRVVESARARISPPNDAG